VSAQAEDHRAGDSRGATILRPLVPGNPEKILLERRKRWNALYSVAPFLQSEVGQLLVQLGQEIRIRVVVGLLPIHILCELTVIEAIATHVERRRFAVASNRNLAGDLRLEA